jgi:hypothetical protein
MKLKATQYQQQYMTRALLTEGERDALTGDTNVEYPAQYKSNSKKRIRERVEKLEKDLEILDTHAPELADEIRDIITADANELEQLLAEVKPHN